jgi:hypothetical protein
MKTLLASLVALVLVSASPITLAQGQLALAQEQPEAALADRVFSIRLEIERLDDARREVVRQRNQLAGRLSELAQDIKKRKVEHKSGGILPDLPLQEMLRRSQELSETLTLVTREMEVLNQARKDRLQKLSRIYDQLVDRTVRSIRSAGGARKTDLIESLAEFRNQRDRVRRELRPHSRGRSPLETRDLLASNDSDELRERADAVRDEQDRLRRRLKRVECRIAQVQADRRLEREMQDFQEDQALFGEEGRILGVTRSKTGESGTENKIEGEPDPSTAEPNADYADSDDDASVGGGFGREGCYGGQCGTPGLDDFGEPPAPVKVEVTSIQSGRVPMGVDGGEGEMIGMRPAKRINWLKKRRAKIIEQIKKLQILHDRIWEKAEQIEEE